MHAMSTGLNKDTFPLMTNNSQTGARPLPSMLQKELHALFVPQTLCTKPLFKALSVA